jgi:hypothetical protein
VALLLLLSLSAAAQELIFKDGFENRAPVITSSPETTGLLGELYTYNVEAIDPDGDTLLYLLTTAPGGMAINAATGEISWPMNSEGIFPVEVVVSDGEGGNAAQSWSITVTDVDTDEDGLSDSLEAVYGTDPEDPDSDDDGLLDGEEVFTYLTDPLHPDSDRDDLIDGEEVETYGTDPADVDTDGDGFGDGLEIEAGTDPLDENDFPEGPPDPDAIAPPIDETVATTVYDSTRFLFMGNPPIQTGVTEGTIEPERAAVLRGHVMDQEGAHLPGAIISIKDHPEFGQTISRVDGMFDMVVNGGGLLTINYAAEGSLPAQRQIQVPWQDYVQLPDVVMIPLDSNVTLFDLNAGTMAVAQGSEITDGDGTRQATLMCPPGTTADLVFPDGSTQSVSTLNIRATEYTVGEMGPRMMPAMLPPTSAYTYAVELSADEALAASRDGSAYWLL